MNPNVNITFWDALAGGIGLAVAPLLIHLLPWGDSEVYALVMMGAVVLMVQQRDNWEANQREAATDRKARGAEIRTGIGIGCVGLLLLVIGGVLDLRWRRAAPPG